MSDVQTGGTVEYPEQWILLRGDWLAAPVGPFPSEEEAHAYYVTNQPTGLGPYLAAPTIVRLLHPASMPRSGNAQ